jgi:hypothetical protein
MEIWNLSGDSLSTSNSIAAFPYLNKPIVSKEIRLEFCEDFIRYCLL